MEKLFVALVFSAPLTSLVLCLFFAKKLKKRRAFSGSLFMNSLIFLFLITSAFASLEAYYRWMADFTDSFGLNRITKRWFERHYQTNSLGLRDNREYLRSAPEGKIRVTFLGDSFTAGHGIKDPDRRFANLIRKDGQEFEVHIFARNGWDTGAELEFFRHALRAGYQSENVVLIYMLNDIADIVPDWQKILNRIYRDEGKENFWIQNSYFLNTLYYRLRRHFEPELLDYYSFVEKAYESEPWELQKTRLAQLQQSINQAGGRLFAVTFPFLHDLGKGYRYHAIHKRIAAFWQDQNVAHLDLYSVYQDYAPKQLILSRFDAHPNEYAHRLAADAIENFLNHRLLRKD